MSFFDDVYKKLFAKKARGLILHEVLTRQHTYQDAYEAWKNTSQPDKLLKEITESLRFKALGIVKQPETHQFSGKYSNGIAITYNADIEKIHFQFLFDLFSEKVQQLGYKVSVSDLIVTEKKDYVESKEKHYLKTKISADKPPIDQKYGNIIIELILIDEVPSFIRLMAHAYNDRMYKTPEKFEHLAKYLFPSNDNS